MLNDLELAELLTTKFSHDLSGPIGAISNGLEFLKEENPSIYEGALNLIETSAMQSVYKLQFFRQIYGSTPPIGEANLAHLKNLTANFFNKSKITLDWPDGHNEAPAISISPKLGKLILNIILICSTTLIHGGVLSLKFQKLPNGKQAYIKGEGHNFKCDPDIFTILNAKSDNFTLKEINSRNIQIYYSFLLAQHTQTKITIEQTANAIHFYLDHIRSK